LIKELHPGQVVVMDNASFHKSPKTRELIESVGCRLIFLPPYSPDLNPIEKFWGNMKRWIKDNIHLFDNFPPGSMCISKGYGLGYARSLLWVFIGLAFYFCPRVT